MNPVLKMSNCLKLPLLMGGLCLILSGCPQSDPIRQYTVEKVKAKSASSTGDQVWFFKLMGPSDELGQFVAQYVDLLKGTTFVDGKPSFRVPEGWKLKDGPPPRYQTLTLKDTDPPIEVTISSLTDPGGDFSEYLLGNVNRWRRQVALPPLPAENWEVRASQNQELVITQLGDQTMSVVNLEGTTEAFGDTVMLAAVISNRGLTPSTPGSMPEMSQAPTAGPKVKYELPVGWEESEGSSMRLVSLAAKSEDGEADISVIKLGGGGDVLSNINRWRGQVKLEPLEESELNAQLEDVEVDGSPGQLSLMEGPESSIMAAIVEIDGVKWFYKMQGPTDVVKSEADSFREFLKSVKLE